MMRHIPDIDRVTFDFTCLPGRWRLTTDVRAGKETITPAEAAARTARHQREHPLR